VILVAYAPLTTSCSCEGEKAGSVEPRHARRGGGGQPGGSRVMREGKRRELEDALFRRRCA